jgi:hypothetical protein
MMLPAGTLVRIMDWATDYYMQTATVKHSIGDGRIVLYKDGINIGAYREASLVIITPTAGDES